MSGRRSHPRVAVSPAAEGSLRLVRDIVVQEVECREVVAISREPATKGEELAVEMSDGDAVERFQCRVVDSAPLMVDGSLRHRLRLTAVAHRTDRIVRLVPPATERE